MFDKYIKPIGNREKADVVGRYQMSFVTVEGRMLEVLVHIGVNELSTRHLEEQRDNGCGLGFDVSSGLHLLYVLSL